jgi:hypothetical protein
MKNSDDTSMFVYNVLWFQQGEFFSPIQEEKYAREKWKIPCWYVINSADFSVGLLLMKMGKSMTINIDFVENKILDSMQPEMIGDVPAQ